MFQAKSIALLGGLAMLLAACQPPGPSVQVPVSRSFEVGGISWADGTPGNLHLWDAVDIGGKRHICGIGFNEDQRRSDLNLEALKGHAFMVNGAEVLRGAGFFKTVANRQALRGEAANCRDTGRATPSGALSKDVIVRKTRIRV